MTETEINVEPQKCGSIGEKRKRRPDGYWSRERVIETGKKFESSGHFAMKEPVAYSVALKSNLLDEIFGGQRRKIRKSGDCKPRGFWTKERCRQTASHFLTGAEFKKQEYSCYSAARRYGFYKEITSHFLLASKPKGYWTLSRCHEQALRFETRGAFVKGCKPAYEASVNKGFLEHVCSHMHPDTNLNYRMVYIYLFEDGTMYVGITYDEQDRIRRHLIADPYRKDSPVYKHQIQTEQIPQYMGVSSYIPAKEALKIETNLIELLRFNGHNVLNKTKGGHLGSPGKRPFTKEEVLKIAKTYLNRSVFSNGNYRAYLTARDGGYLSEACSHMSKPIRPPTPSKWDKEACRALAASFKRRSDFSKHRLYPYTISAKNGWLNEFFPKNQ